MSLLYEFHHFYLVFDSLKQLNLPKIWIFPNNDAGSNIIKSIPKTNALNDYSASPDFLFSIVDIIEKYKPNIILEAGSGVSTIIASYGLKKYNPDGKIISLDHDKKYADTTKIEIKKHQLEQHSKINDAICELFYKK